VFSRAVSAGAAIVLPLCPRDQGPLPRADRCGPDKYQAVAESGRSVIARPACSLMGMASILGRSNHRRLFSESWSI